MNRWTGAVAAGVAVLAVAAGCTSGSSDPRPAPTTSPSTTTTAVPLTWTATASGETDVDGNFRQGLARSGDGWIFITNNAIYRTDDGFRQTGQHLDAIPPVLADLGYNHLGDPDVADGLIWIPVEREDKDSGEQVTATYDEETLVFVNAYTVPQHHNSFVAVDDDATVYSADEFSDDTLLRYRIDGADAVPLDPLVMSQQVERIQGGDIADGAIWLSTDDDRNGVYRVDLSSGAVTEVGTSGHVDGEGEGIDATDLPAGLLHVLVADAAIVPMWVVDLQVGAAPAD